MNRITWLKQYNTFLLNHFLLTSKKLQKMTKQKNTKIITYKDDNGVFPAFKSEKERIRYNSQVYKSQSIAKAFSTYYGIEVSKEIRQQVELIEVVNIEIGKLYFGTVKEFTERSMKFEIPGVKDELVCKEGLWNYFTSINNFLLTHDNKLWFEVKAKENGKYIVSVLNAYYRKWVEAVEAAANGMNGIEVHIDELVRGGYVCHCDILPLSQLTGQSFTSSVFIPGSHIVLNIEHDFEKWVGQDVTIIPQKFVDFRTDRRTGLVEKSLVGSRKRVLQIMGNHYMYEIWNIHKLGESNIGNFEKPIYEGTVTGVLNSDKKTGVFVELDGKYITGLLQLDAYDLLNYKPGDKVQVKIAEFEVQPEKEPFLLKGDRVLKCNTRPVFEIA